MIDYIKVICKDDEVWKYCRKNLDNLFDSFRYRTIESIDNKTTTIFAEFKGLNFKIAESGVIVIDGSLHKYYNNGKHNYNDFSFESLTIVLDEITTRFKLNRDSTIIQNLEIGVNITTTFNPSEFIDKCLFLFSAGGVIKPVPITKFDCDGYAKGVRFESSEYCIKIYNKGLQYQQDQNILRIEFKTYKSRVISDVGITTLNDFYDLEKLQKLSDKYLLKAYSDLLIDESIQEKLLSKQEQKHFFKRLDYMGFWKKISRTQRKRNRKYIEAIYQKYALTIFKKNVLSLLEKQITNLLRSSERYLSNFFHQNETTNCIHLHSLSIG